MLGSTTKLSENHKFKFQWSHWQWTTPWQST